MGYVFDFHDAQNYSESLLKQRNRCILELENQLMLNLLQPAVGESVLDIGCGTGISLEPLLECGLNATGIDPSPYMLKIASEKLGHKVDLYRGFAEDLPFDDNSFNYASFFTSLEFVEDPAKAIEEACRVAKDRVFIGFLNSYALKGIQRRLQGIFTPTIFNKARFFSVWELKTMVQKMAGPVPINWRTVLQLTNANGKLTQAFEQSGIVQRVPFGAFAGLSVTLVPRFRTRPLTLRYRPKNTKSALTC
ncbi:MAG: class I SAM-dependent methyltransferase [Desulfobacteraceae bacterium]|jgi:SAM-dependent methyltransferase